MESTGTPGKIQVSEMTAHLLKKSGKEHWLEPREDMISAKGLGRLVEACNLLHTAISWLFLLIFLALLLLHFSCKITRFVTPGVLQTWWVKPNNTKKMGNMSEGSIGSILFEDDRASEVDMHACNARLVNWMTELLLTDIRKIVSCCLAMESLFVLMCVY